MRQVRSLAFVALLLSAITAAEAKQKSFESILPPGGRIVAGDLSKNEFFILGKDTSTAALEKEAEPVVVASTAPAANPPTEVIAKADKLAAAPVSITPKPAAIKVAKAESRHLKKFTPLPRIATLHREDKMAAPMIRATSGNSPYAVYHVALNKSVDKTAVVQTARVKVKHAEKVAAKKPVYKYKVVTAKPVIERAAAHLKRHQEASKKLATNIKLALNKSNRHKV